MYIPPSFQIDDPLTLSAFMDANSFATLVTCDDQGVPFASHLPIRQFCEGTTCTTLVSHMARANPQWKHFENNLELLSIFTGPHSYISPSWYSATRAVPTWNYAAVHVYGLPTILDDHNRVVSLLADTVDFYERSFDRPWPGILPDDFRDKLINEIVAFEICVTRVEGKFKLGQNRSTSDIDSVYNALSCSPSSDSRELAALMASERIVSTANGGLDGTAVG